MTKKTKKEVLSELYRFQNRLENVVAKDGKFKEPVEPKLAGLYWYLSLIIDALEKEM